MSIIRERIRNIVEQAFQTQEIQLEDIIDIMQQMQKALKLDSLILVTNRDYTYRLKLEVSCEEDGVKLDPGAFVLLTKEEYDRMVECFKDKQIWDGKIPALENQEHKNMLSCAIMQKGNYLGHAAFCADENRRWTEDEKTLIKELSYLLLLWFGINSIGDSSGEYDGSGKRFKDPMITSAFYVDLTSGDCHGIKISPFLKGKIREWDIYQKLVDLFSGTYVDPIYAKQIQDKFGCRHLLEILSAEKPRQMLEFPLVADNKVEWCRVLVEAFAFDKDGKAEKAYVCFRNVTKELQASSVQEINTVSYAIISAVDLETERYAVYVDNLTPEIKEGDRISCGSYRELIQNIVDIAIDPAYAEDFNQHFSLERLREHFAESSDPLRMVFPCKVGNMNSYWVQLDVIKSQQFDNGKKVVLYFSDVTEKKRKEIELQKTSDDLKIEQKRVAEAEEQAMRDPLTGVYNRLGFEAIVQRNQNEKMPVGIALIDIDHFKTINDTYGHAFGDEILCMAAERLQNSFRNEDKVFRLGGDEFGLLLYDCSESAWSSLQMKFEGIHHYLKDAVKKDIPITLSVGFVQSDQGYEGELEQLADEALYHTKNTGRAGITQIDRNHKILHCWHEADLEEARGSIPQVLTIGSWRVEYSDEDEHDIGLFLDDTAHAVYGISNLLTPRECYQYWRDHITPGHQELCFEMFSHVKVQGQAECIYRWEHPAKGEITLQTGAKYRKTGTLNEIFGIVRELKDEDVVLSYDDDKFIMQAMNRIYFCTYYFDLRTREYYILKGHEDEPDVKERHKNIDLTFRQFVENFVHPDYQQKVLEFADFSTLSDRLKDQACIDCEYLSVTSQGWWRTQIMPVRWDEEGNITHAMSMSACVDDAKQKELKREELYKNALSMQLHLLDANGEAMAIFDYDTYDIVYINKKGRELIGMDMEALRGKKCYEVFGGSNQPCDFCDKLILDNGSTGFMCRELIGTGEEYVMQGCKVSIDGKDYRFEQAVPVSKINMQNNIIYRTPEEKDRNNIQKIFSVFDLIDEIVYVCDMDTYDLIYCNNKTKEQMAAAFAEDQPGQKCYKCLHGMEYPCVFCNNEQLKKDRSCVWSRVNPQSGDNYFIHDSVITLGEKQYRLELAVNESKLEAYENHSKKITQVENYLTQCVHNLVKTEDLDSAVNTVLQAVLDFYGSERAYLFDFDWEKRVSNNTHEVCVPGVSKEIDNLQNVPMSDMHFWIDVFKDKSEMVIEDLHKIADDPSRKEEYDTLSAQGINSIIAVPIIENDKLAGFVGIDNPKRMFDNVNYLKELTYFIGTEVAKHQYLNKLIEKSNFDQMCGVGNRNAYAQFEQKVVKEKYSTMGIAFLDMNGLKYLNDNFGHNYGDRQIVKFCKILLRYYRREQIFRISGDEFVIAEAAVSYADFHQKMRALRRELTEQEKGLAAIGYIWDDAHTPLHLLQNQAEQLMMAEKQKYYLTDSNLNRSARPRYISSVIESMKQDTYMVYLQPKYSVVEGRVYGAEALIRKLNEDGNIVYPAEFITAMEKENAVSFVDFFVFEKVCETLKRWEIEGQDQMVISTNFSRSSIAENGFVDHILEIVERTGVNGQQLILEITETSNVVHVRKLTDIMDKLKAYGMRFALDDMGSEYATLEMLELEGLDMAKFDKSLIHRVKSGTRSQKVLKNLVTMCHSLDMECVAEGVETQEQFDAVKEVGCDRIQGYLIGKPMPIDEFEKVYDL